MRPLRASPRRIRAAPSVLRWRRASTLLAGLGLAAVLAACPRRIDPVDVPDVAVDGGIRAALEARLADEPSIQASRIRVEVEAARVRLYGSVQGIGAWNCAIRNAWLAPGVEGVADFLVIERGPREVSCRAVRS